MNIAEMRKELLSFDGSGFSSLLDDLEAKRKKAFNVFLVGVFISGFIVFFLILTMGITDLVQFAGFGALFVCGLLYYRIVAVRKEAKAQLMPALCEKIGLRYSIDPPGVAISPFKNLSIIPSYDKKKLEDQIIGKVDDIDFELLEAKLIQETRDSEGRTSSKTVFRGFLVRFDFHKNFHGQTVITKDHTFIGNFFTGFGKRGDRVKLEDPDFEDEFEVHSTDQVEARYLLTPRFMERLLSYTNRPGVKKLQLAFKDGSIYMAIKRSKNAFEGGSFNLNDPKLIEENIQDIGLIFDMVTELNLTQETKI